LKFIKFRRPFAAAHVSLFVVLVLVWFVIYLRQTCKTNPSYFEVALLTATIFITFWCNHLRVVPVTSWSGVINVFIGATYDLLVLIILTAIPIAFLVPTVMCGGGSRTKVIELILPAFSIKETITERINSSKSLDGVGVGLALEPDNKLKKWFITNDGVIIVATDAPPAVVILQPEIIKGKAEWKCEGFPTKYMPMERR
jgi:hypothetical protein